MTTMTKAEKRQARLQAEAAIPRFLEEHGWTKVADAYQFSTVRKVAKRKRTPENGIRIQTVPSVWSRPNWEIPEGDCVRTMKQAYKIQCALNILPEEEAA